MIAYIIEAFDNLFGEERPDGVVVYGDTTTTLAAALVAKKLRIPLFHVEAGVRNFDEEMPEEINRCLTDRLASVNYCVTPKNLENLVREGYGESIPSEAVVTGDLMLDIFKKNMSELGVENFQWGKHHISRPDNYELCTIHRASNVDCENTLSNIVAAINDMHRERCVVVPLHPRTAARLREFRLNLECLVMPPLGYTEMLRLLRDCTGVITDSGGLVRQAYLAGKPSLLLLEQPLRPEINEVDCSVNAAPNYEAMLLGLARRESLSLNFSSAVFGDGNAASLIASDIAERLAKVR